VTSVAGIPPYYWHPLGTGVCTRNDHSACGYQFWSGIGSDLGEITLVASAVAVLLFFWRLFNCHADGCYRLTWHVHSDHGHPVCKVHHPHGGDRPHTIGGTPHTDLATST
jgi:hypothetical protein